MDAWSAAPSAVREFMGVLLLSEGKHSRILACKTALVLVAHDPGVAAEFSRLALRSIGPPLAIWRLLLAPQGDVHLRIESDGPWRAAEMHCQVYVARNIFPFIPEA